MKAQIRLILISLFIASVLNAQDNSVLASFCDSMFQVGISEKMIPAGVISVVRDGQTVISKGYGFADIENQLLVEADQTLFQIGSVGKIFTALAVLKLVDQNKLDLNSDIREYLDSSPMLESSQTPITMKHLLTHSAGINERVIGYAAKTPDQVKTLENFLEQRFPGFFQEPGRSISYSNYGYALAGLIIEKVSGTPFQQFVKEQILLPLQMTQSTYTLPDGKTIILNYAKGYRSGRENFNEQPIFYTHTSPAGGLNSTALDMANFMIMLLDGGRFQAGSILEKESLDLMLSRQFSNHPNLSGYTLGFEEQNINGNFAVAKGGSTLGFTSLMYLILEQNIGVFISTNVRSDDFIEMFISEFTNKFIQGNIEIAPVTEERSVGDLTRFEGVYRSNRYNHGKSVENLMALFRDRITVRMTENGGLKYSPGGKGLEYLQVAPLVFQNSNQERIAFKEDSNNVEIYCTSSFAGINVPGSYEKISWYSSPTFINEFFLSFLPMYLIVYILYPLLWLILWLINKARRDFCPKNTFPVAAHLTGFLYAGLSFIYISYYIAPLINIGSSISYGVPAELIKFNYIPFAHLLLLILLIFFVYTIWKEKSSNLVGRIFFTSYMVAALIFMSFLYQWNFIGFNY